MAKFVLDKKEDIVGKEENTGNQHFLLFLQCFQKAFSSGLIDYFRLFIVATGCPSERRSQKTWLVVTGDSARIQDKTTESSDWFFSVLGV